MKISVNTDNKSIIHSKDAKIEIPLSASGNNGLSFFNNTIIAKKGTDGKPGSGGTTNTAGNGINGSRHEPVLILRCDLSATSRTTVNANDLPGRINFQTAVVNHLKST